MARMVDLDSRPELSLPGASKLSEDLRPGEELDAVTGAEIKGQPR